jgi:hypothetical protein
LLAAAWSIWRSKRLTNQLSTLSSYSASSVCLQRSLARSFKEKWPNTCVSDDVPTSGHSSCASKQRLPSWITIEYLLGRGCSTQTFLYWLLSHSQQQLRLTGAYHSHLLCHESRRVVAVKICHLFIPPLISSDQVRSESRV